MTELEFEKHGAYQGVAEVMGAPILNWKAERESKEYDACTFSIKNAIVAGRNAKVTPKKIGQFVTFWKREGDGPIAPYELSDDFDFLLVNVATEHHQGQFLFSKAVLVKQGIVSSATREGKRAFRVYPPWDEVSSAQARKSQKWQLQYFVALKPKADEGALKKLFARD